jgi:hypothetical protein
MNDYSLLLGVHELDKDEATKITRWAEAEAKTNEIERKYKMDNEKTYFEAGRDKPFFEMHEGGIVSADGKYLYFMGIIDILTFFG